MTTQREFPQISVDQSSGFPAPDRRCEEETDLRFRRIEDRLAWLEQMLGQLLPSKCEPSCSDERNAAEPLDETMPMTQRPSLESGPLPPWSQREEDEELDPVVRDYVERLLQKGNVNPTDTTRELEPAADAPAFNEQSGVMTSRNTIAEAAPTTAERNAADEPARESWDKVADALPHPSDLIPLHRPAERETNLRALREVANQSATAAIRTFEKSQAAHKTVDRLPLLVIGVTCGLMLLYSAFATGQTAMFVGAGAAFVGAALTGSQLVVILRRWLAASRPVETR